MICKYNEFKIKGKHYLCSYVKQRHALYCPNSVYMFKWGPLFLQLHFCAQDYLQEYCIACIATNTVAKFFYPKYNLKFHLIVNV